MSGKGNKGEGKGFLSRSPGFRKSNKTTEHPTIFGVPDKHPKYKERTTHKLSAKTSKPAAAAAAAAHPDEESDTEDTYVPKPRAKKSKFSDSPPHEAVVALPVVKDTERVRGFSLTLNNPAPQEKTKAYNMELFARTKAKYLVYGEEVGKQGTPHLQMAIVFHNPRTWSALVKQLGSRYHIEKAKDIFKLIEYCKKDGKVTEMGTAPVPPKDKGQMEKDRWAQILSNAQQGKMHLVDEKIQVLQCRQLDYVHARFIRGQQLEPVNVLHNYWFVGDTGTGKSLTARSILGGFENRAKVYDKISSNKWWDGYADQDYVVIDDMGANSEFMGNHLKRWADHYPFPIEVKGSYMQARPKIMIVTSNYFPEECFPQQEDYLPLQRRFTVVLFGDEKEAVAKGKKFAFKSALLPSLLPPVIEQLAKEAEELEADLAAASGTGCFNSGSLNFADSNLLMEDEDEELDDDAYQQPDRPKTPAPSDGDTSSEGDGDTLGSSSENERSEEEEMESGGEDEL